MERGATEFAELLREGPRDCWIALTEDESKIVARGETMREAVEEARKHGVEDPIVLLVPKTWIPAVYLEQCPGAEAIYQLPN